MTQMCEEHNRLSLLHLLEEEPCDGWCSSADPCDEVLNAVRNCNKCEKNANPSDTSPYFDGEIFEDKNGREINWKKVIQYAKGEIDKV
jgi:hypothetical protein